MSYEILTNSYQSIHETELRNRCLIIMENVTSCTLEEVLAAALDEALLEKL